MMSAKLLNGGELFWVEFFKQAEIKAGIFAMD